MRQPNTYVLNDNFNVATSDQFTLEVIDENNNGLYLSCINHGFFFKKKKPM